MYYCLPIGRFVKNQTVSVQFSYVAPLEFSMHPDVYTLDTGMWCLWTPPGGVVKSSRDNLQWPCRSVHDQCLPAAGTVPARPDGVAVLLHRDRDQ